MWKAVISLIVGIMIGMMLASPVSGGKKKKINPDKTVSVSGVLADTNRDGVVEFSVPLWRPFKFVHISCSDGYSHDVFTQVVLGPVGLPRLYMRWKVNLERTHIERVKKFGPGYQWNDPGFGAQFDRPPGEARW
jgi:hypothetical protein